MKIALLILSLLSLFVWINYAQTNPVIKSIISSYERKIERNDKFEITSGKIYFISPASMYIITKEPENQWMKIDSNQMVIYYPDSKKVFKINAQNNFELPFLPTFLLTLRKDYGLSELGFNVTNYGTKNDTIETYWKSKKEIAGGIQHAVIKTISKLIKSVEITTQDSKSYSRIVFDDYINCLNNYWFPMQFQIHKSTPRLVYHETVSLKEAQFNVTIPDSIINFKIPDDAEVKVTEW